MVRLGFHPCFSSRQNALDSSTNTAVPELGSEAPPERMSTVAGFWRKALQHTNYPSISMIPNNNNLILDSPINNADSVPYGIVCIIHFILKVNNSSRSWTHRIRNIEASSPAWSIYLRGSQPVSVKSLEERESIFE